MTRSYNSHKGYGGHGRGCCGWWKAYYVKGHTRATVRREEAEAQGL